MGKSSPKEHKLGKLAKHLNPLLFSSQYKSPLLRGFTEASFCFVPILTVSVYRGIRPDRHAPVVSIIIRLFIRITLLCEERRRWALVTAVHPHDGVFVTDQETPGTGSGRS